MCLKLCVLLCRYATIKSFERLSMRYLRVIRVWLCLSQPNVEGGWFSRLSPFCQHPSRLAHVDTTSRPLPRNSSRLSEPHERGNRGYLYK